MVICSCYVDPQADSRHLANKEYYQPLLAALPPSERKVPSRSNSQAPTSPSAPGSPILGPITSYIPFYSSTPSSATSTSTRPPSTSSTPSSSGTPTLASSSTSITSTPPLGLPHPLPILSRKSITEIFSNFSAILDVSKVVLSTLEAEVPNRPSDPVPISISKGSKFMQRNKGGGESDSSLGITTSPQSGLSPSPSTRVGGTRGTEHASTQRTPAQPIRLGKALLPLLPFLKTYSPYVSNFSATLSRLALLESGNSFLPPRGVNSSHSSDGSSEVLILEERERWRKFCDEKRKKDGGPVLGLNGLLLNLVQRVPRYRFMLANLLEFTDREHPDWKDLTAAFELVDQGAYNFTRQTGWWRTYFGSFFLQ